MPFPRCCDLCDIAYAILHTGQHYSEQLVTVFFEQLQLPEPDYNLQVGTGQHGTQTWAMLGGIEKTVLEAEPDVVLVQEDTNSVLVGAIAMSKPPESYTRKRASIRVLMT